MLGSPGQARPRCRHPLLPASHLENGALQALDGKQTPPTSVKPPPHLYLPIPRSSIPSLDTPAPSRGQTPTLQVFRVSPRDTSSPWLRKAGAGWAEVDGAWEGALEAVLPSQRPPWNRGHSPTRMEVAFREQGGHRAGRKTSTRVLWGGVGAERLSWSVHGARLGPPHLNLFPSFPDAGANPGILLG